MVIVTDLPVKVALTYLPSQKSQKVALPFKKKIGKTINHFIELITTVFLEQPLDLPGLQTAT